MAATGGPIESISIRGRRFPVAGDADADRNLGGFTNDVQSNGDGSARLIKTRIPWHLKGINVQIDNKRKDQEFLRDSANLLEYYPVQITFVDGTVYDAKGQIIEEANYSSQNATAELSLAGPGSLGQ